MAGLSSCIFFEPHLKGNGNEVSEIRKCDNFNQVSVSSGLNVYFTQGAEQKVVVTADQNLIDYIDTKVFENRLSVTATRRFDAVSPIKINITLPDIENIKAFAGSNIYSQDTIRVPKLELISTAGANIKLDVVADNLNVMAVAGSNIKISGKTSYLEAKANSGSNIFSSALKAGDAHVTCNTGANIWVAPVHSIKGISGSGGNIYYTGAPSIIELKKNSGGNVIKKEG